MMLDVINKRLAPPRLLNQTSWFTCTYGAK